MKLLVINNLASGLGEGAVYDYIRSLAQDGDEVVIRSTDGTTDLRTFLHDADTFDAVVASGGDGTVSTVAHLLADTAIPLIPFPAGTANILALNLFTPLEPHAMVEMTRKFKTLDFDIGEIKLADGKRFGFTIMAGAGYDAAIMRGAQESKKFIGQMAYFTSAVANNSPQFSKITLRMDDTVIESSGVGVLIINFSKIQFDIHVVHENKPRDGMFDVVILNTKDAFGLIPALFAAILDKNGEFPQRTDAFEVYRTKQVSVDADPPLPIQFDGECTQYTTPFKAKVLERAAHLVVTDECIKQYE